MATTSVAALVVSPNCPEQSDLNCLAVNMHRLATVSICRSLSLSVNTNFPAGQSTTFPGIASILPVLASIANDVRQQKLKKS